MDAASNPLARSLGPSSMTMALASAMLASAATGHGVLATNKRSWEEHCDKCDEDPVYNDEATIAAAVLADEVLAPWQQSEVVDESTFELVTTRSFIGIARSEFTSMVGHAPSEAQVTETDMPAESSAISKGVLVQNPMVPFVQYDLVHRRTIGKAKSLLQRSHDCRAEVASEVMQDARESRDKEAFFTKLRNCVLSVQELDKKLGNNVFTTMFARLPGNSGGNTGSNDNSVVGGNAAGSGSSAGGAHAAFQTPPRVWPRPVARFRLRPF